MVRGWCHVQFLPSFRHPRAHRTTDVTGILLIDRRSCHYRSGRGGYLELQPQMRVLPSGHLAMGEPTSASTQPTLATLISWSCAAPKRGEDPALTYWREFGSAFMRSFAQHVDVDPFAIPELSALEAVRWFDRAPPMSGGEYLDAEVVQRLWSEAAEELADRVAKSGLSARAYLERDFPDWADVGRVHFHVAESKNPERAPFAFLATYTVRVPGKARLQHRPLGLALRDSIEAGDRTQLMALLRPIERAAADSDFLSDGLATQSLFRPIYLSPSEALSLLNQAPSFARAGIVFKTPDWWKGRRPPRAKVSVTVGQSKAPSHVGLSGLVDFDVAVAVGDEQLSPEELQELLAQGSGLAKLRGRWVEVDQKRLQSLMERWDAARRLAGAEGITLGEALRLLARFAGKPGDAAEDEVIEDDFASADWCDVVAGKELSALLAQLRQPDGDLAVADREMLQSRLKAQLRPYQWVGVRWLRLLQGLGLGGCLADDMGLGKTLQIIALLTLVTGDVSDDSASTPGVTPEQTPALLVVPASLMGNWRAELQRFAPHLRVGFLHPSVVDGASLRQRPTDLARHDVLITTYSMVNRLTWMRDVRWRLVVADEAQAIKNPGTQQSRNVRALQGTAKFAMTGTPVENKLADLWAIFDFSCPGLLGNRRQYEGAVEAMAEGQTPDYGPLRQLISPYLLRRKKTDKSVINDLPEKIEMPVLCPLTKEQAKLYQQEVDELAAALAESEGGMQRRGLVLKYIGRFKQICNHPSQFHQDGDYDPAHSGKMQRLGEIVETIAARQEKVLVFTQFRELTDILAHFLAQAFGRPGLVIHGTVPVKRRQGLVEQFQQEDGPPFFVLSLKAGGSGLNLTQACHVVHFDRWWNPAVENQATDRAFRIGQKRSVMVHKLISQGTIEEKIDLMIASKRQLADAVIESGAEVNLTELSDDEIMSLVRLDISQFADS